MWPRPDSRPSTLSRVVIYLDRRTTNSPGRQLRECHQVSKVIHRHLPLTLLLEQGPGRSTLTNDRLQGTDGQLSVVGDRHRDGTRLDPLLHDDVAASPPNLDEALHL